MDKAEIVKLREFLRKSFGSPTIQVTPSPKSAEAADVSLGERKIGKTLCINPGSEANHGILRGYVVDVGKKGIELAQRVEG